MDPPLVNETSFSAIHPSAYSLTEIWLFGGAPDGILGLQIGNLGWNLNGLAEGSGNCGGSAEALTVTEQSGGGGRRKRVDLSSEDESLKMVSTSSATNLSCSRDGERVSTPLRLCGVVLLISMKAQMDTRVQRRLDCLYRHFQLPPEMSNLLHAATANSEVVELKHGEDDPVVVGGMVLDIHATPVISAHPRTTTPGKVNYAFGGVARNVAECMSKLGTRPFMISAVGLDMAGKLLLENWKSAGLSTRGILKHKDIGTAVVCNILDTNGELAAAVASFEAIEKHLTSEWISQFKHSVYSAPLLMVDANLNPHALEVSCRLAAEHNIPVWFEPVSVAKSRRIASVVKYIFFASPNEDELIAMANALSGADVFSPVKRDAISNKSSAESLFHLLKPAIWVLLEKGIKVVVVTLGSDGVFLCSKGGLNVMTMVPQRMKKYGSYEPLYKTIAKTCSSNWLSPASPSDDKSHLFAMHFPAIPALVAKLTGAGDCLVGGVLASICAGLDVMQSVAVGIAASKTAVESETNVPNAFNLTRIADDAAVVYSAARVLFNQSMQ